MKYITLEELENRKKILIDRRKKLEEHNKKNDKNKEFNLTSAFNDSYIHNINTAIMEIDFLIDFVNIKQQKDSMKGTWCYKCKKYKGCKIREKSFVSGVFMHCVYYEEKEII